MHSIAQIRVYLKAKISKENNLYPTLIVLLLIQLNSYQK